MSSRVAFNLRACHQTVKNLPRSYFKIARRFLYRGERTILQARIKTGHRSSWIKSTFQQPSSTAVDWQSRVLRHNGSRNHVATSETLLIRVLLTFWISICFGPCVARLDLTAGIRWVYRTDSFKAGRMVFAWIISQIQIRL